MPSERERLMELAERVEAATGSDRDLDDMIVTTALFEGDLGDRDPIPRYTASLDAALSLVPEGAAFRLYHWPKQAEGDRACVLVEGGQETWAATPALALVAAALKALAAKGGTDA